MSRIAAPALRALAIAILVVALQAVLVAAFAWPATSVEPRDLPVVVAGPAPATKAFAEHLAQARPGAFEVRITPDAATADQRLRARVAYGAFVVGPEGLTGLHLASAASPTAAQLLTQVAQATGQGRPVPVDDVVPADGDDPRGAGMAAAVLPLVLTSLVAGLLLAVVVIGRLARVAGLVAYGALAGLAVTAVLQYGFDALPGDYLTNAGVVGLLAMAMGAAVAGLGAVLGRGGIVLAVLVLLVLGNPLSGLTSAPELLPQPWGAVGQLLPPGAGGTLLRSVASFDGAGSTAAVWVLLAWTCAGLVLAAVMSTSRLRLPAGAPARETATLQAPA